MNVRNVSGSRNSNQSAESVEQRTGVYLKALSQFFDYGDGGIARTAFKIADIGSVYPCFERKLFLRSALCCAQLFQICSDTMPNVHGWRCARLSLIVLQTISDNSLDWEANQSIAQLH